MDQYYEITGQIWVDKDGKVTYFVNQSFDEDGDNHEILAYGEDEDWDHARKEVFKAIAGQNK